MKKTLVCVITVILALCAGNCFASNEGAIYTQKFSNFTSSADGSTAPNGLTVLKSQTIGDSGLYSADGVYPGAAVIKTNEESEKVSLIYNFPDLVSDSFVYEISVLVPDTRTKRSITVSCGDEAADIVTFGNGGYVCAGQTNVCGLKLKAGEWYRINVAYSPASGTVTAEIIHNNNKYIAQGKAELSLKKVESVSINTAAAVESQTYIDDIRIMNTYERNELLYADNFNDYSYSAASGNNRWVKSNVSYASAVTDEYGSCLEVKKTVSNDADVETTFYGNGTTHYTGDEDIYYNISLMLKDFNCVRHIVARDYSESSTYKYARSFGYIDENGYLHWNGIKQNYKFETDLWYNLTFVYNRVTGNAILQVSDKKSTFSCRAEAVWKLGAVTRVGIELNGMTGSGSELYIDNVSLWVKPTALTQTNKTNWYEAELNSLNSIADVDTTGKSTVVNGGGMIELSKGKYIDYKSETTSPEVFIADVYIKEPVALAITDGNNELVSFTSDFKIKSGSQILGNYTAGKTYRIFITNNSNAQKRYITVAEGRGRLVGFVTTDAARNAKFKIQNSLNKAYIDNIGLAQSGKSVLPISVSPVERSDENASFAEIVFPTYIDRESVLVYVNGKQTEAQFIGDKTVRIPNLETDTYYNIKISGASDLLGNILNADIEFSTGVAVAEVEFSSGVLQNGNNPIEITIK